MLNLYSIKSYVYHAGNNFPKIQQLGNWTNM